MNILLLSCSPKRRGGASRFLSKVLKWMLLGCTVTECSLRSNGDHTEILERMKTADALVLSLPLYVDGIPSHVLRFFIQAEQFCRHNACRCRLYIVSNGGFIEGRQNQPHLEQCRCFARRAGLEWCGGVGIGGGVALLVFFYVLLAGVVLFAGRALWNAVAGAAAINAAMLWSLGRIALVWAFLNSGMLLFLWLLSRAVRHGNSVKNRYARAMIPTFLFLLVADVFMVLAALLNGKTIFSLFRKDDTPTQ